MVSKNYTPIDYLLKKYQLGMPAVSRPKETEPQLAFPEEIGLKEIVETKSEEEIKPYISRRHETIELPPDLKKLGLQQTGATKFPSYQNVKLPISDEKIITGSHAPITSSIRWLATLALYLLKKAHLALRIVGGRVVRIVKT